MSQHESVGALRYNVDLNKSQTQELHYKNLIATFDSTFHYILDTISIPLLDEFSTDRFQKYDADFTDVNVSDTVFHRLEVAGVVEVAGSKFSSVPTYRFTVDTTLDASDQVDTAAFPGVFYKIYDLANYPVTFYEDSLYPAYDIFDTINVVNLEDSIYRELNLVCQDSARLFFVKVQDQNAIWADNYAYRNYTKAIRPFSLGVATMDGIDENGIPYLDGVSSGDGIGDYLTSKEIDLNFTPADEIYFSFLYQGGGHGNAPEVEDSLVVEFFAPDSNEWYHIWSTTGAEMDTFFRAHIGITEAMYLKTGFRFRFKNYADLVGNLDNWHIDYIQLRSSPGFGEGDTIINDVAWSLPINTLLDTYTSVPWKHYNNLVNQNAKMTDSMPSVIRNSIPLDAFDQGGEIRLDEAPNTLIRTVPSDFYGDISNGLNYKPSLTVDVYHDIRSDGYFFPGDLANDSSKTFKYRANLSTSSIQINTSNDTNRSEQVFSHFYAYDDGSPEEAYGTIGAQSELAYKFTAYEEDSLVGVAMRFVKSVADVSDKLFLLTVWNDNGGQPGEILYQDDYFSAKYPEYTTFSNGFHYYVFKDSQKVAVPETFYVGWKQAESDRLDVGLDRNIDNKEFLFYSLNNGSTWNNSTIEGSVMIRPVIDSEKLNVIVGVDENQWSTDFSVYPNPAHDQFSLISKSNQMAYVSIVDVSGKEVLKTTRSQDIQIHSLEKGIYFVNIYNEASELIKTEKLIKQ